MRTHVEFLSNEFPPYENEAEQINPGRYGKRLADFLAESLITHGFKVKSVSAEDWGWMVEIENESFPLWIGCGNYEEFENGFLCFIEPSKPFVRKWFSKIETLPIVERLASALESILQGSGKVSQLRWWSESEAST
ncbi:MAG: hypothetical protein ACM31P_10490 [Actinomycetota bacterium]